MSAKASIKDAMCSLYLAVEPGAGAADRLLAALSAAPAAAVLIGPIADGRSDTAAVRMLVEAAQAKGCAALIEQDARLARTLKADGVHLAWSEDIAERYTEAREMLGAGANIGVSAGASRHEAMVLAEAGADYIGFGRDTTLPDDADMDDHRLEQVEWWAEIFAVPCVAFDVTSVGEAAELAEAGADFLVLALRNGETASAIVERVRAIDAVLAVPSSRSHTVDKRG